MKIFKMNIYHTLNEGNCKERRIRMKYKQYKLSGWCKRAQIKMIEDGITVGDLVGGTGYCRQHISSVLNGRLRSDKAVARISKFLGISTEYE